MTSPTRFPAGISTNTPIQTLAQFGMPDPTKYHTAFYDFNVYTAGDWIVTAVGSGSQALTAGDGGLLLNTNAAGATDSNFFQSLVGSFLPTAGKKLFFKSRFKVSDVTLSAIVMGLQVIDTTPLTVLDGIFFQKPTAAALIDLYVKKDSTTGQNKSASAATMVAADIFTTWGFAYNGSDAVIFYIDDIAIARLDASSTYLPDAVLALSFGIQNGEAVAKTMTLDYVFAAMER